MVRIFCLCLVLYNESHWPALSICPRRRERAVRATALVHITWSDQAEVRIRGGGLGGILLHKSFFTLKHQGKKPWRFRTTLTLHHPVQKNQNVFVGFKATTLDTNFHKDVLYTFGALPRSIYKMHVYLQIMTKTGHLILRLPGYLITYNIFLTFKSQYISARTLFIKHSWIIHRNNRMSALSNNTDISELRLLLMLCTLEFLPTILRHLPSKSYIQCSASLLHTV